MTVQLTIRNVPDRVRDELANRAARRHQSMQEFLLGELEHLASRPSLDDWLLRVRSRKLAHGTRIDASEVLRHRDADRR